MPEKPDAEHATAVFTDSRAFAEHIRSEVRPDAGEVKTPPPSSHGFVAITPDEVFKTPNDPAYAVAVQREALLQEMLKGRMDEAGGFVPEVTARQHGEGPFYYGMKKVDGVITTNGLLATLPPQQQDKLAKDVAGFMLGIQVAITAEDAQMLGLEDKSKPVSPAALSQSLADPLVQATLGPELLAKARQTEKDYAVYVQKPQETVFTHGDLNPYNLLYDTQNGKLNGVIDFGLAAMNTVEHEFMRLGERPKEFLQAVADHYEAGGGGKVDIDRVQTLHAATLLENMKELAHTPARHGYMKRVIGELSGLLQDTPRLAGDAAPETKTQPAFAARSPSAPGNP